MDDVSLNSIYYDMMLLVMQISNENEHSAKYISYFKGFLLFNIKGLGSFLLKFAYKV